jgi:hypothetical protein
MIKKKNTFDKFKNEVFVQKFFKIFLFKNSIYQTQSKKLKSLPIINQ